MALSVDVPEGLQLNLTRCHDCLNGFMVEDLTKNVAAIQSAYAAAQTLRIVSDEKDLNYTRPMMSRRGFFAALRTLPAEKVDELGRINLRATVSGNYGIKTVPERKAIVNKLLSKLSDEDRAKVLQEFFYRGSVSGDCTICMECEAVCSSGAISGEENEELLFNAKLCNGCGLCVSFCSEKAITMEKGLDEKDRDRDSWIILARSSSAESAASP